MNFENFDESIGLEGYYNYIMNKFFPESNEESFSFSAFSAEQRLYRRGTNFFRVRKLNEEDLISFFDKSTNIKKKEFFPPNPEKINVGRFNNAKDRVLYLSEQPPVAIAECMINNGDHYLLSIMKIQNDMIFIHLARNSTNHLTQLLYRLINSPDRRFYTLTNKIHEKLLSFTGFHGIAYDSVRMPDVDLKKIKNLVIKNEYIKDVCLVASTLTLMMDDKQYEKIIFQPISSKKKNKIKKVFYLDNKSEFIKIRNSLYKVLDDNHKIIETQLNRGVHAPLLNNPIKILERE